MEENHELTEKFKVLENEIFNARIDLKNTNLKLEIAYNYEDELLQRMEYARKQTQSLRNDFFCKATAISQKYEEMKIVFESFFIDLFKI